MNKRICFYDLEDTPVYYLGLNTYFLISFILRVLQKNIST